MKTLEQFIKESYTRRNAAKILGKPPTTVTNWVNSGRKYYVVDIDGEKKVLEEK